MMATGAQFTVVEVGYMRATSMEPADELTSGEVGYITASIKTVSDARVGDTVTNAGKPATKELDDGWTVVTRDKSLSAQWEHMVVVTATGYEVLTPWPEGTGAYPAP